MSYLSDVEEDLRDFVRNNYNIEEMEADEFPDANELYDAAFADDGVTGNGSGSYYYNTVKAEERIARVSSSEKGALCDYLQELGYFDKDGEGAVMNFINCLPLSEEPDDEETECIEWLREVYDEGNDSIFTKLSDPETVDVLFRLSVLMEACDNVAAEIFGEARAARDGSERALRGKRRSRRLRGVSPLIKPDREINYQYKGVSPWLRSTNGKRDIEARGHREVPAHVTKTKSHYGKAEYQVNPDGSATLWSYGTKVMEINRSGQVTFLYSRNPSQTTVRHMRDFCYELNAQVIYGIATIRELYDDLYGTPK